MKKLLWFVIMVIMLFCTTNTQADSLDVSNSKKRPTVGLVLSGGGAKGLAHIGVLKALEKHKIPIDYIAGTSMGAIIGGLYASGYTVEEIEQVFYSNEMTEWMSGKIDRKYQYYYKEANTEASMFSIGFDIDNKFRADIPMSLINPMQMDFSFMEFFTYANDMCEGDYDKLMLPFFCIASDVTNKKQSIQRRGSLAKSVRASMTFPFFFSPIVIDGNLMCDGGVYNNFPSYEMQDIYAPEVIIGVQVADNFDNPTEDDLLLYIENMVTIDTKYDIPNKRSILLKPDMKFISIMDFSAKEECIRKGLITAESNIKNIKQLIGCDTCQSDIDEKRERFNQNKHDPNIENVIVHSNAPSVKSYTEKLLLMGLKKDSVSLNDIKYNYLAIASMPSVQSIRPNIYYDNFLQNHILDVDIKTKNLIVAKVGGMLSTDPISNLYLGLEHTILRHYAYKIKADGYIGRYYSSIGADFGIDFPNRRYPFLVEMTANVNNWNYFRTRSGLFEYSPSNYIVQQENNVQLLLSTPTFRRGKLTFKAGIGQLRDKYFNDDIILSSDTNDVTEFNHFVAGFSNTVNTLDDDMLPTAGFFSKFNIQFVTGKEQFTQGNISYKLSDGDIKHTWFQLAFETKYYKSMSTHFSLGFINKMFYSFQDLFVTRKSSLLNAGVFTPTLETATGFYSEYRANQFIALGVEPILILGNSFMGELSLRGGYYIFSPIREILANDNNQPYYGDIFRKFYNIASLNLIVKTRIGNLSLGFSYTQREKSTLSPWNMSLSFGKIIFNRKNIER